MVYPLNTTLIIRSNYGDESIALIQALFDAPARIAAFKQVMVVYVHTGWAATSWSARIEKGIEFVQSCGFKSVCLEAQTRFETLVRERKSFPSSKFQWCAGFLKGLPLMTWLDENDPSGEWIIALPKRQALYRQIIPEIIEECEFHGERKVWHPNLALSDQARDELIKKAGFEILGHRSLECDPCTNSNSDDLARLSEIDRLKMLNLEKEIGKVMFPVIKRPTESRENFSMGCGDPFGCGL